MRKHSLKNITIKQKKTDITLHVLLCNLNQRTETNGIRIKNGRCSTNASRQKSIYILSDAF